MAVPASDDRFPNLDKYEVKEELGHGGMATVYRARDVRLGRDVAVKVMHPHLRNSEEIAHRFFSEARAVAMLRHRNIVEVYDVSSEADRERYLVVELVRGSTLRKLLAKVGVMPPEIAGALSVELLSALAHAHAEGVIHRDVKPENVLIEQGEERDDGKPRRAIVKLTDFGIAKLLDAQGVTSTGQVLGSPAHMAPEQIDGQEVDGRADVFGLGVLTYECMVGHLPFEGANPAQVLRRVLEGRYPSAEHEVPEVGKRWSALLDRALAGAREERFPDARAMREAVHRELARVGFDDPSAELARFLAEPDAYRAAHAARMQAKLTELGHEARKNGDILEAASAFNRALAYAPSDPKLLRLVSGLQKAERQRRAMRAAVPRVALFLASAMLAYVAASRALLERPRLFAAALSDRLLKVIAPATSSGPSTATSSGKAAVVVVPVRTSPVMVPRVISRSVLMKRVRPQNGVLVSVDGAPVGEARDDLKLTMDGKSHALVFTCRDDMCEPEKRTVLPGSEDEDLDPVELRIRPARLIVEGKSGMTYQIRSGAPSMTLVNGVEAQVPMTSGASGVKLVELETGEERTVELRPGKLQTARFR